MRARFRFVALVAVLVAAAGCGWGQAGFDAGRAGWSSIDGSFTTGNVGSTALLWEADGATSNGFGLTVPVIDAQRVFFASGGSNGAGTLEAFDRNGGPDCTGSPRVCQPIWRATLPFPSTSDPIVAGRMVFLGGGISNRWTIVGFDAAGVRGCSGTPRVCQPVWQAAWPGGPTGSRISLMAAGGTVFATTEGLQTSAGPPSSVSAFDAAGVSGCSGAAQTSCTALFSVASDVSVVYPSVAAGVLFVPRADGVGAYDAAGVAGCSGSPKVCQPLWRAAGPGGPSFSVVSGGILYAEVLQPHPSGPWVGTMYAYDAAGKLGCSGNPKVCVPRLVSAAGLIPLPVVANGRVWTTNGDPLSGQALESFAADGGTGCAGMIPSCAHLSTATLPVGGAALAATKSVLFAIVGGNGLADTGRLMAFGLDGTGCTAGTPAACTPLLSIATSPNALGLAVANGRIAMVSVSPRVNAQALFVYGLSS